MKIVEKQRFEVSKNDGIKLQALLDSIDEITTTEQGTVIKFKGNLITSTEGTQIFHSEFGNIVQLANSIHLNPPIKNFNDIDEVNLKLIEIKKNAEETIQECGCPDCNPKGE